MPLAFCYCRIYSPAQLVRGFPIPSVSDLLDKNGGLRCLIFSFPPPILAFVFVVHRVQHFLLFSFVCARRFASNLAGPVVARVSRSAQTDVGEKDDDSFCRFDFSPNRTSLYAER